MSNRLNESSLHSSIRNDLENKSIASHLTGHAERSMMQVPRTGSTNIEDSRPTISTRISAPANTGQWSKPGVYLQQNSQFTKPPNDDIQPDKGQEEPQQKKSVSRLENNEVFDKGEKLKRPERLPFRKTYSAPTRSKPLWETFREWYKNSQRAAREKKLAKEEESRIREEREEADRIARALRRERRFRRAQAEWKLKRSPTKVRRRRRRRKIRDETISGEIDVPKRRKRRRRADTEPKETETTAEIYDERTWEAPEASSEEETAARSRNEHRRRARAERRAQAERETQEAAAEAREAELQKAEEEEIVREAAARAREEKKKKRLLAEKKAERDADRLYQEQLERARVEECGKAERRARDVESRERDEKRRRDREQRNAKEAAAADQARKEELRRVQEAEERAKELQRAQEAAEKAKELKRAHRAEEKAKADAAQKLKVKQDKIKTENLKKEVQNPPSPARVKKEENKCHHDSLEIVREPSPLNRGTGNMMRTFVEGMASYEDVERWERQDAARARAEAREAQRRGEK